jgi:hypothetical protein
MDSKHAYYLAYLIISSLRERQVVTPALCFSMLTAVCNPEIFSVDQYLEYLMCCSYCLFGRYVNSAGDVTNFWLAVRYKFLSY